MTIATQDYCKCGAHRTLHTNGVGHCTEPHCGCLVFRPQATNEQEVSLTAEDLSSVATMVAGYPRAEICELEYTGEWMSLPKADVPNMITQYIDFIETTETDKVCRCTWAHHPDDEGKEFGKCRECGLSKQDDVHEDAHTYKGVRRRKVAEDPNCYIHTKEGLVRGFFEWAFKGLD